MNQKLQSLLEERKKAKGAKKGAGFTQTKATDLKGKGLVAPKKGPSGSGPEGAKTPVKPKQVSESGPAYGARFNSLFEQTMREHQELLSEEEIGALYNDAAEIPGMEDDLTADDIADLGGEGEDDSVTLTIPKDVARQLYDLLAAVVNVEGEDDLGLSDNPEGGEVKFESADEEDDNEEDKEVVEEDAEQGKGQHYKVGSVSPESGKKLTNPGSKVVKSKLGSKPGKAAGVKGFDSSGRLSPVGAPKQMPMTVKSNMSGANKDFF